MRCWARWPRAPTTGLLEYGARRTTASVSSAIRAVWQIRPFSQRGSGRGGLQAVEEGQDGVVERVVAVAGDHVAGTGDVGELRVRHGLEQLAGALLGQQVAHAAADEQHR